MSAAGLVRVSFVVPIKDDPAATICPTLDSILAFRRECYAADQDYCRTICVGEIPDAPLLRGYAGRHRLCPGDHLEGVYPVSDWPEWEREHLMRGGEFLMPRVAGYLNVTMARADLGQVVVLLAPGKRLKAEAFPVLCQCLEAVDGDFKLVFFSHDNKTPRPPYSVMLSQPALTNYGLGLAGASGYSIACEKKFFGGVRFTRTDGYVDGDVAWYLSTVAFQCQEYKRLKMSFASWV
jgi:hypothetical protein